MRMKRLISSVVLAVMLCLPMLADSYHDALVQYMNGSGVVDMSQYTQMLQPMTAQMFPDDPQAAQAFTEYMTTQIMTDITEIYEPAFRRHVSLQELQELAALYADPKYAGLQQRSMQIVSNMQQTSEYQLFVSQFSEAIQNIMQDKPARNVQIADEVSKEYADAFYQFYRQSGIDEILMRAYRSIFDNLGEQLRQSGISNPQTKVDEIIRYTTQNMPKVLLALFQNALTIDDLHLLTELTGKPAYKHSMEAVAEMASDPMALGIALIRKMAEWMEVHYPKYAAPLNQTLQVLGQ